jgi:gas vesicle protein
MEENMADEELAEAVVTEEVPAEAEELTAELPEEGADGEQSKTLLSGDEGEGEGEGVVPEKYAFEPPEGVEVDQSKIDVFGETAKEMGLTQAQFQQLVEYDIKRSAAALQDMSSQFSERINHWAEETKADKELGGEALDANLGLAKQAIDTFGSPQLAKLIDAPSADNPEGLGLGNHPEVIRLFYRVGRAISESDLVTGDTKIEGRDSLEKMYPTMFAAN